MRILYLLPAVTHPTMRGELRHYHFVRTLAQRHEISVMALTRTPVTDEALSELRASARRVLITHVQAPPANAAGHEAAAAPAWRRRYEKRRRVQLAFAQMRNELLQLVASESFDVAVVYGVDLQPVVSALGRLPIVADICDAQSMRIRQSLRFVSSSERAWQLASWWRTRRAERQLAGRAHQVTFVSERDLAALPFAAGRARVIPNGVDTAYWSRSSPAATMHHLVFTGVMDYGPNADAGMYLTTEILPRVRSVLPGATLTIAGRNPSPELRRAASSTRGVEITGFLDDLRPSLERASVFAAPLRFASGTQNKILESMAMGVPVVTSRAAADGLRMPDAGEPPVLVADQPDAFTAHVIDLLSHADRRRDLATRARAYVWRHFDWERSASQLEACCQAAATATLGIQENADARRVAAHR